MKVFIEKYKNDILLIIMLLCLSLLFLAGMRFFRQNGAYAVVTVDGVDTAKYDLSENIEVTIDGCNGGTNRMVIEDGSVYFAEATCPNGICVWQGKIKYAGQSIICLPNKVVVTIKGSDTQKVDAVVR